MQAYNVAEVLNDRLQSTVLCRIWMQRLHGRQDKTRNGCRHEFLSKETWRWVPTPRCTQTSDQKPGIQVYASYMDLTRYRFPEPRNIYRAHGTYLIRCQNKVTRGVVSPISKRKCFDATYPPFFLFVWDDFRENAKAEVGPQFTSYETIMPAAFFVAKE